MNADSQDVPILEDGESTLEIEAEELESGDDVASSVSLSEETEDSEEAEEELSTDSSDDDSEADSAEVELSESDDPESSIDEIDVTAEDDALELSADLELDDITVEGDDSESDVAESDVVAESSDAEDDVTAEAVSVESEDASEAVEEAEEPAPPAPTLGPGELTEEELAALDAEIAAQLDAEEEAVETKHEWYFIHSYSGMENKVKKNLEHRAESMGMTDLIAQVVVPTETEIEIRSGVRKEVEKRVFPGYVLVNMILDEDSWYVVRNTPGVTGFVGMGNKPTPLSEDEVSKIMVRLEADEPRIKVNFELGENVRITGGPFAEFNGIVEEIYADKGKAKVMVSFFNRETPVEVDFVQIERDSQ